MMGTGTNVQLRAKAIHHVTCPWRPADLTQRDGRLIRQGNANAEVHNFQYATVGSYDSAAWDGIQRKATMIQQVLRSASISARSRTSETWPSTLPRSRQRPAATRW
jgi:hypothetical protein